MCSAGRNLMAASDFERVLIIGISRFYGERATKYKVVISTLAVAMPRNNLAGRQREDARLNVDAFRDHFNIFDRIIGLRRRFCWHRNLLPLCLVERNPARPAREGPSIFYSISNQNVGSRDHVRSV